MSTPQAPHPPVPPWRPVTPRPEPASGPRPGEGSTSVDPTSMSARAAPPRPSPYAAPPSPGPSRGAPARRAWLVPVAAMVGVVTGLYLGAFVLSPTVTAVTRATFLSRWHGSAPTAAPPIVPGREPVGPAEIPATRLPLGEPATVGDYEVTVLAIDLDADEKIRGVVATNPAPVGRFVEITLMVRYSGEAVGRPADQLLASYVGADGAVYDERTCLAATEEPVYALRSLVPGESGTYRACIDVPVAAVVGGNALVEELSGTTPDAVLWQR